VRVRMCGLSLILDANLNDAVWVMVMVMDAWWVGLCVRGSTRFHTSFLCVMCVMYVRVKLE